MWAVNALPKTLPEMVDAQGRVWPSARVRAVAGEGTAHTWYACDAGLAFRGPEGWQFFEGKDGLPFNEFTCAVVGPEGELWLGTSKGLIRFENGHFAYRQGPRWLPDDQVQRLAIEENGSVWVETPAGIGKIERRSMTLLEKAAYYEEEIETLIKRTPYGYVSPVRLKDPGERSEVTRGDNDNDGLWTAMYGASQCYAYAVLKQPIYKERATQAFEALRFLQMVTQSGEVTPPPGYVARTIRSVALPDPNEGRKERDERFREENDRLWKVYEPRWPMSGDGKWYWKSDTSSDELDGHYFLYGLYHDLVAETEAERAAVAEVVAALTDHLIVHGFTLVDHDGKPTRWGRFDPEALNHDPNWHVERGLNSLSMLAYLAVASHITQEPRFEEVAKVLREKHGYATNAMVPKSQRGFGSGNQSDDEMAFMGFYHLINYTEDSDLRARFAKAFHDYWLLEKDERNPFFHFAYAAVASDLEFETPWRTVSLAPHGDWLEDSVATLHGFPLDRANWPHTNRHRLDVVSLGETQSRSLMGPDDPWRGYRVDGKVLPVEERHFNHWNTDPWQIDYRGDGRTLACGTVFLLPYYMGRYHGFLKD